jgi:hypothetical protein
VSALQLPSLRCNEERDMEAVKPWIFLAGEFTQTIYGSIKSKKVQEAKGLCKDRSKWKKVMPSPMGNGRFVMYVCNCLVWACYAKG